jgi:hypothetical protein
MIHTNMPELIAAEVEAKTRAEPPPDGMAWSLAWDRHGRRPDLDALVPVHWPRVAVPAFPATLILSPGGQGGPNWLAATLPDDRAVPGTRDRLTAYLGTPNPERDA